MHNHRLLPLAQSAQAAVHCAGCTVHHNLPVGTTSPLHSLCPHLRRPLSQPPRAPSPLHSPPAQAAAASLRRQPRQPALLARAQEGDDSGGDQEGRRTDWDTAWAKCVVCGLISLMNPESQLRSPCLHFCSVDVPPWSLSGDWDSAEARGAPCCSTAQGSELDMSRPRPDPGPTVARPWPDLGPTPARPWPGPGPTPARPWPSHCSWSTRRSCRRMHHPPLPLPPSPQVPAAGQQPGGVQGGAQHCTTTATSEGGGPRRKREPTAAAGERGGRMWVKGVGTCYGSR